MVGVAAWCMAASSQARVNVVTLPGRDSTQLTIYNSVDLTMVKETRHLTLRKGLNRLEFSWANTLIDPTSVEFRALTHTDEIEVLDVSFPPRVTNTLEWRLQSGYAGEVEVEIRYFTSGISWQADYTATLARDESRMQLEGAVTVHNRSGEDYNQAQVRLIVGVVRLVEDIARLAQVRRTNDLAPLKLNLPLPAYMGVPVQYSDFYYHLEKAPKQITKEAMSEYFLYTVEGREDIPDGWSRKLPSFQARDIPVTSYYKYEKEAFKEDVIHCYRFKNDTASHLGKEPLPDGRVIVVRSARDDGTLEYVGAKPVKYIPINEEVELNMGPDPRIIVRPVLMDYVKTDIQFSQGGDVAGWTVRERWEIELRNSRDIDVVVDFRRSCKGDWSLSTSMDFEKMNARKVKFVTPVKPREGRTITYDLVVNHGNNAKR